MVLVHAGVHCAHDVWADGGAAVQEGQEKQQGHCGERVQHVLCVVVSTAVVGWAAWGHHQGMQMSRKQCEDCV